jgi:hypothetical protein
MKRFLVALALIVGLFLPAFAAVPRAEAVTCTIRANAPTYSTSTNRMYYSGSLSCSAYSTHTLRVRLRREFAWEPDQTRGSCLVRGYATSYSCGSSGLCNTDSGGLETYHVDAYDLDSSQHISSSSLSIKRLCGSAL